MNPVKPTIDLSVIVPTYGGRESIRRVVESLLGQGDTISVIVVLDGPNPRTRAILSDVHSPRLTVVEQPRQGVSAARNLGLSVAGSDWIAFVDDDDLPRGDWLETWEGLVSGGACGAATGGVAQHRLGAATHRVCMLDPKLPTMDASTLLAGAFIVKRELLLSIGGYDERLRSSENQDLGLRLCEHLSSDGVDESGVYSTDAIVIDVFVEDSESRSQRYGRIWTETAEYFLIRYPDRMRADPKHKADLCRIIARWNLEEDGVKARRMALSSVFANPGNRDNWRMLAIATLVPSALIGRLQGKAVGNPRRRVK